MLFRSVLLIAIAGRVFGQQTLKDALGLTEMQIWQLRQAKLAVSPPRTAALGRQPGVPTGTNNMEYSASVQGALQNPILDASQQAKLREIVNVLDRWRTASEAMAMGLISAAQWPGSSVCLPYPIRTFPTEFDVSDAQLEQWGRLQRAIQEPLWAQIREKAMARSELLDSKSQAGIQLDADLSKLNQQLAETRPPRDLLLAILNNAQKARVAVFEADLKLVREAIELKLIPRPEQGEALCQ
jgi:hypothetical protein